MRVELANTFWSRLVGLLNRSSLDDDQGILLIPCTSIHTFGMRFAIDVVFLDRDGRVLGFADGVKSNRIRTAPRGTVMVLEVADGNRSRTGIHLDDCLIFD
ncbi:MAG: DUF192 domain-containing protein [Gammaproteobacteria bacterium]